jgi:magnesium chelatase family protein
MLAAACNPCPCGYFSDPKRECICTPERIQKYISKLSGPVLDRIDLHVEVPAIRYEEMAAPRGGDTSETLRKRVTSCREVQRQRYLGSGIFCNAHMLPSQMEEFVNATEPGRKLLESAIDRLGLSARAYDRVLRVSRTIADMAGTDIIAEEHLAEAIQYRSLDRKLWVTSRKAA